jgi:hypothetical protein
MIEEDKDILIGELQATNRRWKMLAVTTSSVLGLLLLLSTAAVAIQWRQAQHERMRAIQARDSAEAALVHAQEAVRKAVEEEQ